MAPQTTFDKHSLAKFLFHLGKGLWKSVPIIGPVVDEVLYAQYESRLLHKMEGLSEEDVRRITEALPKLSESDLVERFREVSLQTQLLSLTHFSRVLEDVHTTREDILDGISSVNDRLDDLPSMLSMIHQIRERLDNRSAMETLLLEYERRRQVWFGRMSQNQRKFLNAIPSAYTTLEALWKTVLRLVPDCGYKEFRFRLHEFEWVQILRATADRRKSAGEC